jgi:hypothetical protein
MFDKDILDLMTVFNASAVRAKSEESVRAEVDSDGAVEFIISTYSYEDGEETVYTIWARDKERAVQELNKHIDRMRVMAREREVNEQLTHAADWLKDEE